MAADPFDLAPEFWDDFAERCWERKPEVLRGLGRFAEPEDVLRALERGGDAPGARTTVWRNGEPVVHKRRHLPAPGDGSLRAFVERAAGGDELCGVQYGVHVGTAALWLRAREFLAGLFRRIGLPPEVDMDVFFGRYRATPRGPHTDSASNFSFPIEGTKTMLFWPAEFFEERGVPVVVEADDKVRDLDEVDFEAFRSEAEVLQAAPGDVIYWPSSHWHMSVSDAVEPTMTLNLALYVDRRRAALLAQSVATMLDRLLDPADRVGTFAFDPDDLQATAARPPDGLADGLRLLGAAAGEQLGLQWLTHATAFGFARPPAPREPVRLSEDDVVRGDPRFPIVWREPADRRLWFAANGALFAGPAHPAFAGMLGTLNSGAAVAVRDLLDATVGPAPAGGGEADGARRTVRELLESLVAFRAISVAGH